MIKSCSLNGFVLSPGGSQLSGWLRKLACLVRFGCTPHPPTPTPPPCAGRQRTADSSRCSCDRRSSQSQARVDIFRGSFWEGYQVGTPALPVHRWNSQGDTGQEWSDRLGQIRSQTPCAGPGLFGQRGQNVVGLAMSHTTPACPPPPPVPDLQEGLLCPALPSFVLWPSFPLSYRPFPLSLC